MKPFSLGTDRLTWSKLTSLASKPAPLVDVAADAWTRLDFYREIVEKAISSGKVIYGINTGFGFLSDVRIENDKLQSRILIFVILDSFNSI